MADGTVSSPLPDWLPSALASIGERDRLATLEEQREAVLALASGQESRLRHRLLGRSAEGRAIDLLTVGEGARSVLVVGGPHSNEPVGGVSVVGLLELLLGDPALCRQLDCTWHFVPCIDPDGLSRNARWIAQPLSLARYLDDYFRPAFHRQPEYTFPLEATGFGSDRATSENLAWQHALEHTRPALQISLHNSDVGGAFFLLSENHPVLSTQLATLATLRAMDLSLFGEPLAELEPYANGVFALPDIGAMASSARTEAGSGAWAWTAGDSSTGFARRFGTRSLVPEVPLWTATPRGSGAKPAATLGALLYAHLDGVCELLGILDSHAGSVSANPRADDLPWTEAVIESRLQARHQVTTIAKLLQSDAPSLTTTVAGFPACMVSLQLRLFLLRSAAMLRTLSRRRGLVAAADECDQFVQRGLSWMEAAAKLEPARVSDLVAIQSGAALLAAAS